MMYPFSKVHFQNSWNGCALKLRPAWPMMVIVAKFEATAANVWSLIYFDTNWCQIRLNCTLNENKWWMPLTALTLLTFSAIVMIMKKMIFSKTWHLHIWCFLVSSFRKYMVDCENFDCVGVTATTSEFLIYGIQRYMHEVQKTGLYLILQ